MKNSFRAELNAEGKSRREVAGDGVRGGRGERTLLSLLFSLWKLESVACVPALALAGWASSSLREDHRKYKEMGTCPMSKGIGHPEPFPLSHIRKSVCVLRQPQGAEGWSQTAPCLVLPSLGTQTDRN